MNITILGTGAYGIALSKVLSDNGNKVLMWTKVQKEYEMLLNERSNKNALPEFKINDEVKITMDMREALEKAEIIFLATSIKYVKNTIDEMKNYYKKNQHICIACKGIDQESLSFASHLIKKELRSKKVSIISGGTFAIDMINTNPMALIIASDNLISLKVVKNSLQNSYLKVVYSKDVLGVELCGAIKNVIAIGCGIIDGLGYSDSTKSMFITKVINDISNLIYDLGGNRKTILTYAGIGDLWLTCSSLKSRNYSFGKMIGEKKSKETINNYIKETTIEGLYTLKSLYLLLNKHKYKMKIIEILYRIIINNEDVDLILNYLNN